MNSTVKQFVKGLPLAKTLTGLYRARLTGRMEAYLRQKLAVRSLPNPALGKRVLLATSLGAYQPALAIDSLLAMALRLRRAETQVLLCDGVLPACQLCDVYWFRNIREFRRSGPSKALCPTCFGPARRLFSTVGASIHTFGSLLTEEDREWAQEVSQKTRAEEIRTFTDEGVAVGEHAAAGALRFFARGDISGDAGAESILRRYFCASLLSSRAIAHLLKRESFDVVVFHHGIYVPQGLIGEACRRQGVRVVNWHVGYRKGTFIFSHHDTYHKTLMSEPIEKWTGLELTPPIEQKVVGYLQSRWMGGQDWIHFNRNPQEDLDQIQRETGIHFDRPSIGLLTNVIWDAQLHYPSNAFSSMLDWLFTTIDYFRSRPDLQLIIRVHPAEVSGMLPSRQRVVDEIAGRCGVLPANIHVIPPESKVSTYKLMMQCDTVLIYGTKTGVELASFGIPVVVAGEAWIRGKGLTIDVRDPKEYLAVLQRLPLTLRMSDELIRRARTYAYHFFFRRMIPVKYVEKSSRFEHYGIRLADANDLTPGTDPAIDTICDGILNGADFIYPDEVVSKCAETGDRLR